MAIQRRTELEVYLEEMRNSGTSWTKNKFFDDNGYLHIKNLCNPEKLFQMFQTKKEQ